MKLAFTLAGASLILFFFTFWRFFQQPPRLRWLTGFATLVGTMSGLCFMGVAFTPADVQRGAHIFFVTWAFRLFPLAVACYAGAVFAHLTYPRRGGWLATSCGTGEPIRVGLSVELTGQRSEVGERRATALSWPLKRLLREGDEG